MPDRPKIYFGWILVAVAFLSHFMSVGTGLYAMNAFMQPLCDMRGWTRTDLNFALVAGTVAGVGGQFVYGSLLPHISIRWLMVAGMLSAGTAFIHVMRVTTLWQFYLLYMVLFLGNGAYGGIVANTVINNWFVQKRGKALGIATSGVSLAGAVIPLAAMHLIVTRGVFPAANFIGTTIILLAPLAWLTIRDWPEEYGLHPDGSSHPTDKSMGFASVNFGESKTNTIRFTRTAAFWKLGFAFGLLIVGTVGVMSQLKPRLVDIGFTDLFAMGMLSVTALAGTAGKSVWGWLCDRFTPWRVGSVLAAVNALGLAIALCGSNLFVVIPFTLVFGFAMGGIMSLFPVLTASLFGRKSFPRVYRFLSLFMILQVAGYIIAGQSFDRFGTYDTAYIVFSLFDIIAAVLLWTIQADGHPVPD